jgi:hypothetical protein
MSFWPLDMAGTSGVCHRECPQTQNARNPFLRGSTVASDQVACFTLVDHRGVLYFRLADCHLVHRSAAPRDGMTQAELSAPGLDMPTHHFGYTHRC